MEIKKVANLPNGVYHNSKEYSRYWSSSNLKEYLNTPKEAIWKKIDSEHKESQAMTYGTQLHDFLASKHTNGQSFEWNIIEPPINPKTGKAYGYDTKAYKTALEGIKNPISADYFEFISDIWSMILRSEYSWFFEQEILHNGIAEPSFFVEGMYKYKYRPDITTDKYIFDYKTAGKKYWTARKLNNRITELGYDISAAMYQYFEFKRTGIWKPFLVIWILKEPPFDILISDISQHCFEFINGILIENSGAKMFLALKDQHEACQDAGRWPGIASQFNDIDGIKLAEFIPKYERDYNTFYVDNKV